jgi:hypothetical protein
MWYVVRDAQGVALIGSLAACVTTVVWCAQKRVALLDGCLGSDDADSCRAVLNGAMTRGVHSALQVYTSLALELIALRRTKRTEVRCAAPLCNRRCVTVLVVCAVRRVFRVALNLQVCMADTRWSDFEQLSFHIRDALARLSRLRQDNGHAIQDTFLRHTTNLTVRGALYWRDCAATLAHRASLLPGRVLHPVSVQQLSRVPSHDSRPRRGHQSYS